MWQRGRVECVDDFFRRHQIARPLRGLAKAYRRSRKDEQSCKCKVCLSHVETSRKSSGWLFAEGGFYQNGVGGVSTGRGSDRVATYRTIEIGRPGTGRYLSRY